MKKNLFQNPFFAAGDGADFFDGFVPGSAIWALQSDPFSFAAAGDISAAKSGGGSKPGGGGGGGGGGGTVWQPYISGTEADDSTEFNIALNFSGSGWTQSLYDTVKASADLISSIITGDITDVAYNGQIYDDLTINFSIGRIDGAGRGLLGNVLAQTSDIVVRDEGDVANFGVLPNELYLPVEASIRIDSYDAQNFSAGTWDAIILHEMVHALGFVGAIFDLKSLVSGDFFIGADATAAYGGAVPLETGGGSGTAGSHWSETAFAPDGEATPNDLMTGYIGSGESTVLSDTTVGALADLGYTVIDPTPDSPSETIDYLLTWL